MKILIILLSLFLLPEERETIIIFSNKSCLACFKEIKTKFDSINYNNYKVYYYNENDVWANKANKGRMEAIYTNKIKIEKTDGYRDSISPCFLVISANKKDTTFYPFQKIYNQNGEFIFDLKLIK